LQCFIFLYLSLIEGFLKQFYNSKDGLERNRYIGISILSKADGDILDPRIATLKNNSGGCI